MEFGRSFFGESKHTGKAGGLILMNENRFRGKNCIASGKDHTYLAPSWIDRSKGLDLVKRIIYPMALQPIFLRGALLPAFSGGRGFTLVELLVVLGLISILALLAIPAVQGLQKSGNFSRQVYDVMDSINFARSYALSEDTYVYIGLTEVDRTQNPGATQNPGLGRVVLAAVATKDGMSGVNSAAADSWMTSYANGGNLLLIRPVQDFDFLYIAPGLPDPATGGMARPSTSNGVQVVKNSTTMFPEPPFPATPFSLPLGSAMGAGKYNFNSAIPFNPQGQIILNGSAVQWIEIDFQPYVGAVTPTSPSANQGNQSAIVIDGATGAVNIYRP